MSASKHATPSFSMPRMLHARLKAALPRHGDRSKLVARLIEMWLNKEVIAYNVFLRSKPDVNVVQRNN